MATTTLPERKGSVGLRASISQAPAAAQAPQTPQRTSTSVFSSPGAGYRPEEDVIVFEIGARHLRAGLAGDSLPRCTLKFGEDESTRVGDFRKWLPGFDPVPIKKSVRNWCRDQELWQMDLREADAGLVEDKFERAIRIAYSEYLLMDPKSKKVLIALPSTLPRSLISILFTKLFQNFQVPSISLLPVPLLSVIAAGQRSGLVVDIGWSETIITSVYEFRETRQWRSNRAMKQLSIGIGRLLERLASGDHSDDEEEEEEGEEELSIDFDRVDEVLTRIAWCDPNSSKISPESESEESENEARDNDPYQKLKGVTFEVSEPQKASFSVPAKDLAQCVEKTLFEKAAALREIDDHELPLQYLVHRALLSLSNDVRTACISKIIVTGGGSKIPGVRARLTNDLKSIIAELGWDPVVGRPEKSKSSTPKMANGSSIAESSQDSSSDEDNTLRQTESKISELERLQEAKAAKDNELRVIETLGAWSGASLAAEMQLRGRVEVEREVYLQAGLLGAKRELEPPTAKNRQSLGLGRAAPSELSNWTLGPWG